MKRNFNPLALLGLLGLIGVIGPLTGKVVWYSWFAWFAWFGNYNKPTDERFFTNVSKTGLACFAIAILGLTVVVIMRGLSMPSDIIFEVIGLLFAVLLISFTFLFRYFEEYGN